MLANIRVVAKISLDITCIHICRIYDLFSCIWNNILLGNSGRYLCWSSRRILWGFCIWGNNRNNHRYYLYVVHRLFSHKADTYNTYSWWQGYILISMPYYDTQDISTSSYPSWYSSNVKIYSFLPQEYPKYRSQYQSDIHDSNRCNSNKGNLFQSWFCYIFHI